MTQTPYSLLETDAQLCDNDGFSAMAEAAYHNHLDFITSVAG